MTKKSVIISVLILLTAFLAVGLINAYMGRSGISNVKQSSGNNAGISDQTSKADDYSYIPLENVLKTGSSGDEVKRVQYILKQKGFYNGEISGNFDEELKKAVEAFQKSSNISKSGIVNMDTIALLLNSDVTAQSPAVTSAATGNDEKPTVTKAEEQTPENYENVKFTRDLYPGMTGDDVKKAQYLLKKAGYYKGDINGKYDTSTKNAVIAFQKDNAVRQTGNVGEKTREALTK